MTDEIVIFLKKVTDYWTNVLRTIVNKFNNTRNNFHLIKLFVRPESFIDYVPNYIQVI